MTTPTGSHATPKGSGRTPLPKAINQNVFDALKPYLINTHRAIVDGQGAQQGTVTTRSYGPCNAPTGIDAPTLIGYSTNVMMDGYTPPMPYEGGPARGDPIRTMETTPGNPLHLGIVTVLAHKLPFLSASTKFGKGLTEKDYGKYDVTTPDGVLHTAPGTKDPIKTAPEIDVEIATIGGVPQGLQFDGDDGNGLGVLADGTTVVIDPTTGELTAPGTGGGSGAAVTGLYKSGFGTQINGVTPPTGVTLALAAGVGLGIGLYDYLFTKRTSTHKESGPSAPLVITTTGGNQQVTITLPALDPVNDPLTIGYSIYRSAVGGTGTPISQCSGVTSTVDGTGKTTYQYQIPASYLLSYDPSILAVDGAPPLPIDPATGLACTFDSGTGLFMSGLSVFDATLPQTYTSGQGYTFVADHGAGIYTDAASDASIATNKRPPGDNTPEIDTLLATVDETLGSALDAGLINTAPSGGLLPLGRGLKTNLHISGGTPDSALEIIDNMLRTRVDAQTILIDPTNNWLQAQLDGFRAMASDEFGGIYVKVDGTTVSYDGDGNLTTIDDDGPTCCACTPTVAPKQFDSWGAVNEPDGYTSGGGSGILDDAIAHGAVPVFISGGSGGRFVYFWGEQYFFKTTGTWSPPLGAIGGGSSGEGNTFYWYGIHDTDPAWLPHVEKRRTIYAVLDLTDPAQLAIYTGAYGGTGATFAGSDLIDYTPKIPRSYWGILEADTPLTGVYTPPTPHTWGTWMTVDPTNPMLPPVDAWDDTALGPFPVAGSTLDSSAVAVGCYSTVNTIVGELKAGSALFAGAVTAASVTLTGTSTLINYGRTDHRAMTAPATPASGFTSLYSKTVSGTTKLYYKDDAGTEYSVGAGSGGTVTSVGLSAPAFLTVGSSPVTGSGTIGLTLATQTANTVFAGPTTGGAAAPDFRALVAADIPDLSATYALAGTTGGAGELLMTDGVTNPPVPITNEAGDDWLYEG